MLNLFYQKLQLIMTMLGYYDGLCDGVWGPKCIEAKRKWELHDDFEPGVPSNGLPFNGRGKLPKGMSYSYKGLDILWDKWDEVRAQEILAEKGELLTAAVVHEHIFGETATARTVVNEPVAVASSVPETVLASSVMNVTEIVPADSEEVKDTQEEDVQEVVQEESVKAESAQTNQKQNWTHNRQNRHNKN